MINHKNKDINTLITDLFIQCIDGPICVYANWGTQEIVSEKARTREEDWLNKNWKYSFLCSVNNNDDAEKIRHIIKDQLEMMIPLEKPIQTSLRNLPIDWKEE
jgi:hypothetical protein